MRPVFGAWFRNLYASENNPTRTGMYVETIRRRGKMNPGRWYRLTDGKGAFWEVLAKDLVKLDATRANAMIDRSRGKDGWASVSEALYPYVLAKMPAELVEFEKLDSGGKARLTTQGQGVVDAMRWLL